MVFSFNLNHRHRRYIFLYGRVKSISDIDNPNADLLGQLDYIAVYLDINMNLGRRFNTIFNRPIYSRYNPHLLPFD